ncbi:hypothetical protein [Plastoroseomonas hellenica]|uniref:hypothetical protein n=1 Tax=Plastoroseomonas hellenica TaxID=2687306 RepID=UPI001BAE2C2C|nr:hypothetical protein [Plastoroseomonas hellenica]MBR0641941.1 hypothetical protein [Plastoroseomonas hellenica]
MQKRATRAARRNLVSAIALIVVIFLAPLHGLTLVGAEAEGGGRSVSGAGVARVDIAEAARLKRCPEDRR